MRQKISALLLVLTSVLLVDIGQLLMKQGLLDLGTLSFQFPQFFFTFLTIFSNPFILLGVFLFVLSSVTWLFALSKTHLSFAYPLLSIGYVIVSLLSWYFFGEALSPLRLAGLGIIVGGVYVMSRT